MNLISQNMSSDMFKMALGVYSSTIDLASEITPYVTNKKWKNNVENQIGLEYDLFDLEEFKNVGEYCQQCVNSYYNDTLGKKPKLNIVASWLNKTNPGDTHHQHHHPNSVMSGVFYLDDHESAGIELVNPLIKVTSYDDVTLDMVANQYNATSMVFPPFKNACIIFPSYIEHKVLENKDNKPRYSIAFNTFFEKGQEIGTEATKLRL